MDRGILDAGSKALQSIAQGVELRKIQAWAAKLGLDAIEPALPPRDRGLDVHTHVLVGASGDAVGVDPGLRRLGSGRGGSGARRCDGGIRLRRAGLWLAQRLGDLGTGATGAEEQNRDENPRSQPTWKVHRAPSRPNGRSKGRSGRVPLPRHHADNKAAPPEAIDPRSASIF
jgi:hypothetical protein